MLNRNVYIIKPDGYSYIVLKSEKVNTILYYKPLISPLLLTSKEKVTYYIVKCRPTYVGYLIRHKITMT